MSLIASPVWKRQAKRAVKAVVAVAVLWAVGRHVLRTWRELQEQGGTLRVDPLWVLFGGSLYLLGLAACGVYYGKLLQASPTPVPIGVAVRAYLISHLGKYVPGKAMVVVMRVGLSVPHGARASTAAIATFYETLVMMTAGALLAAVGFATGPRPVQGVPILMASMLTLAFLVVVEPRLFPRIATLVSTPFKGVGADASPRFSNRLLGSGLGWTLLGWILLGLSQVAVVRGVSSQGVPLALWPLVAGCVALATVAGFVVAVLPGGLGVREWVLMTALGPALGQERAVIAALALRLTWVLAEVVAAGLLALWRPATLKPKPTTVEAPTEAIVLPATEPHPQ
ncbi:MAG: YbhN family protein [Isosphaeraceae bacterium]